MELSACDEYRKIFNKLVFEPSKSIILKYDVENDKHEYQGVSHTCDDDAIKKLIEILKINLIFYCYGETEVVNKYNRNDLIDLQKAIQKAYKFRIPKRTTRQNKFDANHDGLQSELILDYLIQVIYPECRKLGVRAKYRQRTDNNEIKGYDSLYFSKEKNQVNLWLGQAKFGQFQYCKNDIYSDLVTKYEKLYLSDEIFFIVDHIVDDLDPAFMDILDLLDEINKLYEGTDSSGNLIKFLKKKDIRLKIPCLLAYENSKVYETNKQLGNMVKNEIQKVKKYFNAQSINISSLSSEIIFLIFPIKEIESLRSRSEGGLYEGLPITIHQKYK